MRKILTYVVWLASFYMTLVQANPTHPLMTDASAVAPAAEFTRFGFSIYHAQLWAPGGNYTPGEPFVLSLTYSRDIERDKIVQASLNEMQKLGAPIALQPQWRKELERVLSDVKKGDTLSGIYLPGQGAEFYLQNKKLGALDDLLAKYFFSIWLDAKTSEPDLRLALIGGSK